MSGEYDDLLAAFNIPTLQSPTKDGAKVQAKPKPIPVSTAAGTDEKPLLSPKKLALNGNASTMESQEVDDEEDEGWIIDESASTAKEAPSAAAKESPVIKLEDGGRSLQPDRQSHPYNDEMANGKGEENGGEKIKGRRKQIFPKLNVPSPSIPAISTSLTPMQGWITSKNPPMKVTAPDKNVKTISMMTASPPKVTVTSVPSNNSNTPGMKMAIPGCARPVIPAKTVPFSPIIPVSLQKKSPGEIVITASPSNGHLPQGSEVGGSAGPDKKILPVTTIGSSPVSKKGKDSGGSCPIQPVSVKNSSESAPRTSFVKSCLNPSSVATLLDPSKEIANKYEPAVPLSEYEKFGAPLKGYSCRVCKSTFLLESGLLTHFKRPSLDISLKCDVCVHQKSFRFYNKCALWTHLMYHKQHKIGHLTNLMKAITVQPLSQMEFQAYNFGLYCHMTLEDFEKPGSGKQITTPQPPKDGRCPGCSLNLSSGSKKVASDFMKLHLGSLDPSYMVECSTCQRLVRNRCELELHKIFHENGKYCPGCAAHLPNMEAYFQHASSGNCMYWLLAPKFVCDLCKQFFFGMQPYVEHLCAKHFLSYYKCSLCHLAFRNPVTLNKHTTKDHHLPNRTMAQLKQQRIYKCLLCKNVFSGPSAMRSHFFDFHKSHIMGQLEKFVYVCPLCRNTSNWFQGETTMKYHIFGTHRTKAFPVVCDRCGKMVSSLETLLAHKPSCPRRGSDFPVSDLPTGTVPKGTLAATTKRVLRCPMCPSSSKVFYSAQAVYLSHFRVAHKNVKTVPKPQAVDLITTNTKSTTTGTGVVISKQDSNNKENTVMSKKHMKQLTSTPPSTASQLMNSPPKRSLESDGSEIKAKKVKVIRRIPLTCSKCQFSSNDRDQFQEHIKEHKENPSHHQCQECGLCFRSQMAVTRHLAMQHRIQTTMAPAVLPLSSPVVRSPVKPKYKPIIPKEIAPPPVKEKEPEPAPAAISPKAKSSRETAELECTVCYRKFATDALMRNHMRTHGMAFIRSKRTSTS